MNWQNPYSLLALRVRGGEPGAARQFRREMKPELAGMVRAALDHGPADPPTRKILAEVERVLARSQGQLVRTSAALVDVVANRLCDGMIDSLQAVGRDLNPAVPFAARETVLC